MQVSFPQDQAAGLRRAMLFGREERKPRGGSALIVSLISGRHGVGTSTLAANLAAVATSRGKTVCVVNLDWDREPSTEGVFLPQGELPDTSSCHIPRFAGCNERHGIYYLPGVTEDLGGNAAQSGCGAVTPGKLSSAALPFDVALIDVGNRSLECQQAWIAQSHVAVVVSTMDAVTLIESYGILKQLPQQSSEIVYRLVLNQAPNIPVGRECFERVQASSRRFLGRGLSVPMVIPFEPRFLEAGIFPPLALRAPSLLAVRVVEELWMELADVVAGATPGLHQEQGVPCAS